MCIFCNFNCYHCSSKIIRDKSLFTKYDDNIEIILNKLKSLKGLRGFELWVMHRELHYFRGVLLISAFF